MIKSILLLGIILVIIPYLSGHLLRAIMRTKDERPFTLILYGYLMGFAVFYITAIPLILIDYTKFTLLTQLHLAETVLMALVGVYCAYRAIRLRKKRRQTFSIKKWFQKYDGISWFLWLVFFGLLLFQLYRVHIMTSFDGDDAYYVAISNMANQQGIMYYYNPYTGKTLGLDMSHAIAPFPLWIAYVARMTGIHSTIVTHEIMPVVLIPLTYYVYFLIAERLFYKRKEGIPFFMIIISLLQIYGNTSLYTKETFFLTRTWQGKSVYSNLIMALLFYILLMMSERQHKQKKEKQKVENKENKAEIVRKLMIVYESKRDLWVFLPLINMSACLMTAMSAVFSCVFIGISGVVIAVYNKNYRDLGKLALCCIPYVITAAIHFIW